MRAFHCSSPSASVSTLVPSPPSDAAGSVDAGQRQLQALAARQQPPQPARRVRGNHLAMVDDRDAVAEPVGLGHVVRRQQQRDAARDQGLHLVPQEQARLRVQAGRRLVEEQDARVVHQRAGDDQPLRHAAGVVVDAVVAAPLQPELREHLARAAVALAPPVAEVRGVEREVLQSAQRSIEVGALGHDRDPQLGRDRVGDDVHAVDHHAPRRRPDARRQRPDRRRLARAVGPEQPEDLALLDARTTRPRPPPAWPPRTSCAGRRRR